ILFFASLQFISVPHCILTPAPHLPVDPLEIYDLSTTMMSLTPFFARLYATEHPDIPPPIITTLAFLFILFCLLCYKFKFYSYYRRSIFLIFYFCYGFSCCLR